jgi:hypothetical protein
MKIVKEEIFGHVGVVIKFEDEAGKLIAIKTLVSKNELDWTTSSAKSLSILQLCLVHRVGFRLSKQFTLATTVIIQCLDTTSSFRVLLDNLYSFPFFCLVVTLFFIIQ